MLLRSLLCAALAMALATPGAVAARKPRRPPPDEWNIAATLGLGYDDNVFQYSDDDIARFESGEQPERFGLDTIGDFVQTTEFETEKLLSRKRRVSTYLEARVRARLYLRDDEASNLRYQLSLRRVSRGSAWTRLRLTALPDFLVRRLRDAETGTYLPAEFDYTSAQLLHHRRMSQQWSAEAGLNWERRDYNAAFDERDNTSWGLQLEAQYEPDPRWDVWLGYELTDSNARANDGAPGTDVDTSNRERLWTIGARYRPTWAGQWTLSWQHGRTNYTTGLSPVDDPYHAGRRDGLSFLSVEYRHRLSKRRTLELQWRHERQRSHLNSAAETGEGDDALSYDRNVYSLRYGVSF